MALNVNTLMLPAISVIRVALRGPLECVLCLDAFHAAGRLMYAVPAISHLCFAQTGISGNVIIDQPPPLLAV